MKLSENESLVATTVNKEISLTNLRIVHYASIFLKDVSSIHFKSKEYKFLFYTFRKRKIKCVV